VLRRRRALTSASHDLLIEVPRDTATKPTTDPAENTFPSFKTGHVWCPDATLHPRRCDNGRVSDPRPPGEDWLLDDVDWGEPGSRSSSEAAAGDAPARQRSGLIAEAGRGGVDQPSAGLDADIRRRRIAALAAVAVLVGCAIIIPLVVLGGGGGSSAEPTTTPVTTTPTTTTAPTTTQTRPSTTTTTPTTTTSEAPRVTLPAGTTRLERGDSGAAVTQLQKGLVALGFSAGQPDGKFGATTEAAVIDFQQSNDLTPDGVVGADTIRLLNAAVARQGGAG